MIFATTKPPRLGMNDPLDCCDDCCERDWQEFRGRDPSIKRARPTGPLDDVSAALRRKSRVARQALGDFGGRLLRQRRDAQRRDAIALAAQDAKAEAVERETLPRLGYRAGFV